MSSDITGSFSKGVFERRTSNGVDLSHSWALSFAQIFGQLVFLRVKTLSNTNLVAEGILKERENTSLQIDVRRSKLVFFVRGRSCHTTTLSLEMFSPFY